MIDVILVSPEIAGNTGNVIRLCANTGSRLHLVKPLGFTLEDSQLKRAGLDYHEYTPLTVHESLISALSFIAEKTERPLRTLTPFAFTSHGHTPYATAKFTGDDVLIFGCERSGLSATDLANFPPQRQLFLPMRPDNRSLNLANSVAVVVYEAWRQNSFRGAAERPSPAVGHGLTTETLGGEPFDR
jgi:tRNA (cytidine/uridine-2'-O-)-methyltransferase